MTNNSKTSDKTSGDDESGLRLPHLTSREDRNIIELESISRAYDAHVYRSKRKIIGQSWLNESYIRKVHLDMFGHLWDWAGKYRIIDVNIGISWPMIPEQIRVLCDDFNFWDSPQSKMSPIEIAARLQNRLTRIHPFKNGNGRHARLLTDIFFTSQKHPLPKWPEIQLMPEGDKVRKRYIDSTRKADKENFSELMSFISDCCQL